MLKQNNRETFHMPLSEPFKTAVRQEAIGRIMEEIREETIRNRHFFKKELFYMKIHLYKSRHARYSFESPINDA